MKKKMSALVIGLCFACLFGVYLAPRHLNDPFWLGETASAIFYYEAIFLFFIWGILNAEYFVQNNGMLSKKKPNLKTLTPNQLMWKKVTMGFFAILILFIVWAQIPLVKDVWGLLFKQDVIETSQARITINHSSVWDLLDEDIYINNVTHYHLYGCPDFLQVGDQYKFQFLKNSGTLVGYERIN